jgi:SAM-dependent methyltransferase
MGNSKMFAWALWAMAVFVASLVLVGAQDHDVKRESWQRVPDVLEALGARPGAVIADVGAGDGFFTVRLARAVGNTGQVYAVDISPRAVDALRGRIVRDQLQNVEVIESEPADPKLPAASLDAVLIVNAYHEMTEYPAVLGHIFRALKPGGRLVIVDSVDEKLRQESRERQTRSHTVAAELVRVELETAGFDVTRVEDPFTRHGHDDDHARVEWLIVAHTGDRGGRLSCRLNQKSKIKNRVHSIR